MNISTYESKINALEAGGGGGGGSSDGVFVITIDFQNMTSDKTFSEVKNAVLNKTPILVNMGANVIPDNVMYIDDANPINIQVTMFGVRGQGQTPVGTIQQGMFNLKPDNTLIMSLQKEYTFTITEA